MERFLKIIALSIVGSLKVPRDQSVYQNVIQNPQTPYIGRIIEQEMLCDCYFSYLIYA